MTSDETILKISFNFAFNVHSNREFSDHPRNIDRNLKCSGLYSLSLERWNFK